MPFIEYNEDPTWKSNKDGTNSWCMQKMYYLLQTQGSSFCINGKLDFVNYCPVNNYLKFSHLEKGDLYLFFPDDQLTAHYRKSKTDRLLPINETGFGKCFSEILRITSTSRDRDIRFVIPVFETGFTGYGHVVTLIIDYDYRRKTLTPVIYDSIGRGTVSDLLANFIYNKEEATADNTLNRYLQEKFPKIAKILRIAYNHQNRRTDNRCGLFAFRVIHHAINEFSKNGIGILNIPRPKNLESSDTSFLTGSHIDSIQKCINDDSFTFDELLDGFEQVKLKNSSSKPPFFFNPDDFPPLKSRVEKEIDETLTPPNFCVIC